MSKMSELAKLDDRDLGTAQWWIEQCRTGDPVALAELALLLRTARLATENAGR